MKMDGVPPGLHVADYLLFGLMLLGTLSIGVYHAVSGRSTTTEGYLLGGRSMGLVPVSISLMVSFISSILMLGFPAETYTNGGMYWLYAVGIGLGALWTVIVFIPVLHPLELTSINQYLRRRFHSRFLAVLGTLSSAGSMVLYTGTVYFAPATAIEAVTGFPTWASILLGSALTIIYTTIGGIKAVIWTDVFQTLIMVAGLLAVTIQAVLKAGGLQDVWRTCNEWGRLNFLDFNPDPTVRFSFWSLTLGVSMAFLNIYGTTQSSFQRYSSLSSLTKARLCVFLALPWTTLMVSLACLSGLTMFAYYTQVGCDPLMAGFIKNPNQLIPYFVIDTFNYSGIPGILLAALCSASLSSASSALNAAAANLWDDVFREIWPNMTESRNVLVTKLLVVTFGVLATGLGFLVSTVGGTIMQIIITLMSSAGGPTTAMFLLGIAFPFTNWIGASVGGFVGFAFGLWMGFGSYTIQKHTAYLPTTTENCSLYMSPWHVDSTSPMMSYAHDFTTTDASLEFVTFGTDVDPTTNPLHWLYSVSYLWIALFTMLVTVTVGILVSLITGCRRGLEVDPIYLHPWIRRLTVSDVDTKKNKLDSLAEKKSEKSFTNLALQVGNGTHLQDANPEKASTKF